MDSSTDLSAAAALVFILLWLLLPLLLPDLGRFILYPGTQHGFAVRGSKADPAVNAARQDALQQGIGFFKQHLAGVQPPAVQGQADAAAAASAVQD